MNYVIDIILIVLAVLIISASAKKGFLSSLLESLSLIISAAVSYFITPGVSEFIYRKFVYNSVRNKLSAALLSVSSGESLGDKVTKLVESLPEGALRLAESVGIDVNSLSTSVSQSSVGTNEALVNTVTDNIAYNILIVAIEIIVFLVLFVLLSVLIKLFSKLLTKIMKKLRLMGSVNKVLGAVLGIIKAVVVILVVCTVMFIIAGSSDNATVVSTIEASKIYEFISANNPILNFLN